MNAHPRVVAAGALALCLALGPEARAASLETIWIGGAGAWSDAGSWSAGVPANGGGDTFSARVDGGAPGNAADVAFDLGLAEIDALHVDAGDRVSIGSDQNLAVVGGTLALSGELALEGGPGFAVLRAGGTLDLVGGGTLSMSDAVENTLSGITGSTPHLVNHDATIRGAGRIGIDVLRVTNHGRIEATGATPLEINPNLLGLTSTGTLRADAGTLQLRGRNGGDFVIDGAVESAGGGRVELFEFADATGGADWSLDAGALSVDASSTLRTTGALTTGGTAGIELAGLAAFHTGLLGAGASLDVGGTLEFSGDLRIELSDATDWSWDASSALVMSGGAGAAVGDWESWARLEIAGLDLGNDASTHAGNPLGFQNTNFFLPELVIGADAHVVLADLFDNGNRAAGPEALYVDTLRFDDSLGQLNTDGLPLYFNTLLGDPGQILNLPVPEPASAPLVALGLVALAARRRGGRS